MNIKYFHIVYLLLALISRPLSASENYWEAGVGITAISLPLYAGSSVNNNYLIPFPFFHIQTDYLDIDDDIRGFFFESPNTRLTLSADLGVPVKSKSNSVRQDMPDLDAVLQFGPSLEMVFAGGRRLPFEFRFELPLRAAIATRLNAVDPIGWLLEPRVTYETLRPFNSGFNFQISSGLQFASQGYHAYYYDVPIEFSSPERPAFTADAGFNNFFIELALNWRRGDLVYFAYSRYQNIASSVYIESPLVEQHYAASLGIGMIWIFAGNQ